MNRIRNSIPRHIWKRYVDEYDILAEPKRPAPVRASKEKREGGKVATSNMFASLR